MADFPENISSLLDSSQEQKNGEIRLWDLSLKFLEGNQHLTYDRNLSQYITSKVTQGGGTKATVNMLLNVYRNILARLRLSYPGVVVLPASPSTEDIAKAKSAEIALQYYWVQADIKGVMGDVIKWLLTCGTAALHTYFDPNKDSVVTKAVSPYDLFFEPDVLSVDDSRWVAVRTLEDKDALKEAYPDFEEEIEGASTPIMHVGGYEQGAPPNTAEVFEVHWKDGRHAIVLDGTYLYQDDKYPVKAFPVQVIKYTDVPRRLWGLSLLTPLIDLQWLYNRARSQVMNNVELMANPKWLVPKTAGVSKSAITNRPGEKVYYNAAGGKPHQIQSVPMPGYVMDNIQRLQAEILDVSGVHNISLGKRETGITSGKAIAAMVQQDSSQLHVTQMHIETAVQKMAKVVLLLMRVFYKEAKMVRMLDATGEVVFNQIKGTDLVDDPEIFMEAGSLFRDEAQDRDAKVMQLAQLGLIEKDVALKELSFRTSNAFITEQVQGIAHARDMLNACINGYQIEIFRTDDLEAFTKVFGEYMRTSEYYELEQDAQEYIRDIYVSVGTANMPPEQYTAALQQDKVFPRKPLPKASPAAQAVHAVAPGSAAAQEQTAGAIVEQGVDVAVARDASQTGALNPADLAGLLGGGR